MVSSQAKNAYHQMLMQKNYHPVQLIHMLYERVLVHLDAAEAAIQENKPIIRAENMSKAIAIVTELYVSVSPDESEASLFLGGLYEAILSELSKAGNDVEIIRQSYRYLEQLKEVWENTAMQECGLSPHGKESSATDVVDPNEEQGVEAGRKTGAYPTGTPGAVSGQVSFSV